MEGTLVTQRSPILSLRVEQAVCTVCRKKKEKEGGNRKKKRGEKAAVWFSTFPEK